MGNPLKAEPLDGAVAELLNQALEESAFSLRGLSVKSGVKLTRLGDVLRRGSPITIGEIEKIALALGLVPWQVVREAEISLETNLETNL